MSETTPALAAFDYDGDSYVIPKAEEWSLDALEAYEDGRIVHLLREILGAEQWATFKSKPRKVADLNAIFEAAQKGVGLGN